VPRIKQEVATDGRWTAEIYPVMRDVRPYRMACCDCGLVHDIEFWVHRWPDGSDRVAMRVARNNRSTGQVRRGLKSRC